MGRVRGKAERKSERKANTSRANAKQPRGRRPNAQEKSIIDQAKAHGRANLLEIMQAQVKIALRKGKGITRMDQNAAARFVAAKCDLPDVTTSDVNLQGMPPIKFKFSGFKKPDDEAK